jgi:hypothetical protein
MTECGTLFQHHDTDGLLTAFIDAYNANFPLGNPFPWIELWAEDAKWILPSGSMHGPVRPGKHGVADWAKYTIGSQLRERRFVEKRRIVQGPVVAWEGIWAAGTTSLEATAKLPLVMVIEFNQEGKGKSLYSYYDSAQLR